MRGVVKAGFGTRKNYDFFLNLPSFFFLFLGGVYVHTYYAVQSGAAMWYRINA